MKEPKFTKLSYSDAGHYSCEVSMTGLTRRQGFELVIEGKPVCVIRVTCIQPHALEKAKGDDVM